jgi:hypothetical protein
VNPRTIRWQACVTVALLLIVTFVATPSATGWLTCVALLLAVALNAGYAYSLQDRGRPPRRRHGDRWVARYIAFGFGVPLVVAVVTHVAGYEPHVHVWDFNVAETSALAIAGGALFVLIMLSSLIDWYYIRPRIDGVVCEPPCRSSGSDRWKRPTRWWYLHRGIVTLAYMAASEERQVMWELCASLTSPSKARSWQAKPGVKRLRGCRERDRCQLLGRRPCW